jgi:hypothetical protein
MLFIQVQYQEFFEVTYCQTETSAITKSLLLQYIFSGGVHYYLNTYTYYNTRFHLLYDVLVVFDYLDSRHLPSDKLLLASPTQIFPNLIKIYLRSLRFDVNAEPLPFQKG